MKCWDQSGKTFETSTICTSGCMTCVGVYIPIDSTRWFAVHYDGLRDFPHAKRDQKTWQVPTELEISFRKSVRWCLNKAFQDMQQELKAFHQSEDLRAKAVIICPWQTIDGKKSTGGHFIDVLCEFFHLDRNIVVNKQIAHGFIIDHSLPEKVEYLGWTRPGPTDRDFDEMGKLAHGGSKAAWSENVRSVFRATYEYVMPFSLGWKTGLESSDPPKAPWSMEFRDGQWYTG